MSNITPSIGRRIWYWPGKADRIVINQIEFNDPCDAGIVFVHEDGTVNLSITDHFGSMHRRQNVQIVPEGAAIPTAGTPSGCPTR